MNKIINKFLLTGDKFIPELHLRQPGLTYSACRPFTKHREKFQKFRKTGNLEHSYRNELDHNTAYSESKNLPKRTYFW